ncbi:MAG TPA: hypothetical protein VN661_01615 [Candidatus Acidoferrales bacterium]|nr:hypothetical protein [Candidatus Acidoferrales bacterium]
MFTPQTFGLALAMTAASAALWGSWQNTYKGAKGYAFDLFYWDFAIGLFISAVVFAFALGGGSGAAGFAAFVRQAGAANIGYALLAGVTFNLANVLLLAAMLLAGMAVTFPLSIGIALVVGVVLSYALQPRGAVPALAAGVFCALIAVVFSAKAYAHLGPRREISRKGILLCVISGVLMGLWAPLSTRAMTRGNVLEPYGVMIFLTLGALLSCFVFNVYLMKRPIVGQSVKFSGFFEGPVTGHLFGLLGGAIWTTATLFNLLAGTVTGEAISYAIGQSSPMIAALWGVFAWKEFSGASLRAKSYLALMFVFYVIAILLVASATTA